MGHPSLTRTASTRLPYGGMVMCKATFFSLILTCAATLLQDEEVENPKYRAWSEFKPNSWVTYEQPWGVDGKRRETQKLVEISKEKVILELAVVENGLEFPVYRTVIPCTLKSRSEERRVGEECK